MKKIFFWELIGAIFVIIFGTCLHFSYEWFNGNIVVGIFSAVNESVWEHTKLIFYPLLIFSLFEYFFVRKNVSHFLFVKTIQIYLSVITMIMVFYTYTGIIGHSILAIDIGSFFAYAIIGNIIVYRIMKVKKYHPSHQIVALFLLIVIITFFQIATFKTPKLPLFQDKNSGQFGRP